MDWRPISADSHITEPPNCYVDHIDPAWRDKRAARRPQGGHGRHLRRRGHEDAGADGPWPPPAGATPGASASAAPSSRTCTAAAGIPTGRLADQDRDGVAAEVIYPTVGMLLCNHPDLDYKKACFDAYNRWLPTYVHAPIPSA